MAVDGLTNVRIVVQSDALRAKATEVSAKIKTMRAQKEEIFQKMKDTETFWIGDAATAHRTTFASKEPETERYFEEVTLLMMKLNEIAGIYDVGAMEVAEKIEPLPDDIIK